MKLLQTKSKRDVKYLNHVQGVTVYKVKVLNLCDDVQVSLINYFPRKETSLTRFKSQDDIILFWFTRIPISFVLYNHLHGHSESGFPSETDNSPKH